MLVIAEIGCRYVRVALEWVVFWISTVMDGWRLWFVLRNEVIRRDGSLIGHCHWVRSA
jgi:hypothetical protein